MKRSFRKYGRLSLVLLLLLPYSGSCKVGLMAAGADSTFVVKLQAPESIRNTMKDTTTVYKPDPRKAVWYSLLCPGLGQLYNRRFWKLPFVGAGICGVAYSINWNGKYYNAYTNAYRDIMDDDPNTTSYLKLLPPGATFTTSQLSNTLKNRQQKFRRNRDLSYIGAAGVYLLCVLDAFVDAQLYDFDISPDLSVSPVIPGPGGQGGARAVELSLAFRF